MYTIIQILLGCQQGARIDKVRCTASQESSIFGSIIHTSPEGMIIKDYSISRILLQLQEFSSLTIVLTSSKNLSGFCILQDAIVGSNTMRSTSDTTTSCHITPYTTHLISRTDEGLEHITNLSCILVGISHLIVQFILPVLCCLLSILSVKVFYGLGRSNSELFSSWFTFSVYDLSDNWLTDIVGCSYSLPYSLASKFRCSALVWINRVQHLLVIFVYGRINGMNAKPFTELLIVFSYISPISLEGIIYRFSVFITFLTRLEEPRVKLFWCTNITTICLQGIIQFLNLTIYWHIVSF